MSGYSDTILRDSPISYWRLGEAAAAADQTTRPTAADVQAANPGSYVGANWEAEVLADAPVSLWKLAESSGTAAADVQGANNGTYSGGFTLGQTGPLTSNSDTAVLLNGSSGYVTVPYSASLHLGSAMSLWMWVKPTADATAEQELMVRYDSTTNAPDYKWYLDGGNGAKPAFSAGQGASGTVTATTKPTAGVWSLLHVTWDGTTVRHYLNGQPNGSGAMTGNISTTTHSAALFIGCRNDVALFLNGAIFGPGIAASTLSAQRILTHYTAGKQTGLVLGATGALGASGDSDTASSFDGATAWMSVPDATGLRLQAPMSVEAWVKPTSFGSGTPTVMSKGGGGAGDYTLDAGFAGSGQLRFYINNAGSLAQDTGAALTANVWTHVVATYDGANVRFYKNGALSSTVAMTGTVATSTQLFSIGRRNDGQYFIGLIDEPAVYNYALSPTQVAEHNAAGTGGAFGADTVTTTSTALQLMLTSFINRSEAITTAETLGLALVALINRTDAATLAEALAVTGSPNALTEDAVIEGDYVILNGRALTINAPAKWWFAWGEHPAYSDATIPQDFNDPQIEVSAPIGGVAPGTYHFALVVQNAFGIATGGDMTFTIPRTADIPDLLDDLPPFEQGSYDIQAIARALGTELSRVETSRLTLLDNFFPASSDECLRIFESQFGIPTENQQLTIAQRQAIVLAFFKALTSEGTGLEWETQITNLLGTNWSYRDHNPADGTSPPAYTLEVDIPFAPPAAVPAGLSATPASGGGLSATTFYYAVSATTAFGETMACAPVSAVTTSSNKRVNLSWTADATPVSGYNVYRGTAPGALFKLIGVVGTSYTDDGSVPLTSQPSPQHDTSASVLGNVAQQFIRRITPAHLQLNFGYEGGFLVELSQIGVSEL